MTRPGNCTHRTSQGRSTVCSRSPCAPDNLCDTAHGTCVDGIRSYTCECSDGFTGKYCDCLQGSTYSKAPVQAPFYPWVHDGHCASGWISGSNTWQNSFEGCADKCQNEPRCGFFAFDNIRTNASDPFQKSEGGAFLTSPTNCALYTVEGGCKEDGNYPTYTAYKSEGATTLYLPP